MIPRTFVFFLSLLVEQLQLVVSQTQYIQWNIDPRCPDDGRRLVQEPRQDFKNNNQRADDSESATYSSGTSSQAENVDSDQDDVRKRDLQLVATYTNPVTFNLKMYWRPGYCWQREWEERYWCLECPGESCVEWDYLWINQCNQYDSRQRFEWVQLGIDPTSYQNHGQLKVAGKDLCIEQVIETIWRLRPCDDSEENQKIVGFHISNPFQMRPFHADYITDCLTQLHHPKPYEELITEPCYVAQRHRTAYWEVYKPSEALVTLRFPACSTDLPCNECQGDCTEDTDCLGNLRCFQRGFSNAATSIPGCAGVPLAHYADYCYDPLRK